MITQKFSVRPSLNSGLFLSSLDKALLQGCFDRRTVVVPKALLPNTSPQDSLPSFECSHDNDGVSVYTETQLTKIYNNLIIMDIDDIADLHDGSYEVNPEARSPTQLINLTEKNSFYQDYITTMAYVKYLLVVKTNPLLRDKEHPFFEFNPLNNKEVMFSILFNWFYHPKLGYVSYKVLKQGIKSEPEKLFFKGFFLSHQSYYDIYINKNRSVTSSTSGLRGLFFDESVLNRTIRLLMHLYNPVFWKKLNPYQKHKFLMALIETVRKQGNYESINRLFDLIPSLTSEDLTNPETLVTFHVSKIFGILGFITLIGTSIFTMPKKDLFLASISQPKLLRVESTNSVQSIPFGALSMMAVTKKTTEKMVLTASKEAASKVSSGLGKMATNSSDNAVLLYGSQYFTSLKDSTSIAESPSDPAYKHSLEDGFQNPDLLFGSEALAELKEIVSAPGSPRGFFSHSLVDQMFVSPMMTKGLELIQQLSKEKVSEPRLTFSISPDTTNDRKKPISLLTTPSSFRSANLSMNRMTLGSQNRKAPTAHLRISRKPKQKILNLAVQDLKEPSRKVVTAFLPFSPFQPPKDGATSSKSESYVIFAHIVDYSDTQQIQKIVEVKVTPDSTFEDIKSSLYHEAFIGAQLQNSSDMTRDLHVDIHFIDTQNEKLPFSTMPVNYNQASTTAIKKVGGAQVIEALNFMKANLSSLNSHKTSKGNIKQLYPLLVNPKLKPNCLDANGSLLLPPYNAAHFATNQLCKALDFDHATLGTNFTDKAFNGTAVYDNKSWNELNFLSNPTKPLSHALTEGIRDKFDIISQYANEFDDQRLALCVASLVDDTYLSTRSLMAEVVTETSIKPYTHMEDGLTEEVTNIVARTRAAMLHCKANNGVFEEETEELLAPLKNPVLGYESNSTQTISTKTMQAYSRFVKVPKDIIEQNAQKQHQPSGKKAKTTQHPTLVQLMKSLRSLDKTLEAIELNFFTQQTLCIQACLTHSFITDKTDEQTNAFIQNALSYLTCDRRDRNLARKEDPDSILLRFFNTCGLSFHQSLNLSDENLLSLESLLKEGIDQFESEIKQIGPNENSQAILENLHQGKADLQDSLDLTLALSEKLSNLKFYALKLPQQTCDTIYHNCIADSWDTTLALVKDTSEKFKAFKYATDPEESNLLKTKFLKSLTNLINSGYFEFSKELSRIVTSNGYSTKVIVAENKKDLVKRFYPLIKSTMQQRLKNQNPISLINSNISEITAGASSSVNSKQNLLEPSPYSPMDLLTSTEKAVKQAKSKPRLASLPTNIETSTTNSQQKARNVRFASVPSNQNNVKSNLRAQSYKPIKLRFEPKLQLKLTYDGSRSD